MDTNRDVVIGVFHDRTDADRAVADLRQAGFSESNIGVVARRDANAISTTAVGEESNWAEGAAIGAMAGLGAGGLVGLGVLAGVIPVIGPVIVGGTLATILANAAGGAVIGGLVGGLAGLGIPEEEAHYYEDEVKSGRCLVTVKAAGRASEAETILRRHNAYDFHRRADAPAQPMAGVHSAARGEKIQLAEEELRARKTPQQAGEVRVRKEVVTEHETLNVPVRHEEVVIERHPVSGQAGAAALQPGQEIRIPVMEEQVKVEKQAVVKEEVNVGKRAVQENQQVSGTVRKEQIKVEETGNVDVCETDDPTRKGRGKK